MEILLTPAICAGTLDIDIEQMLENEVEDDGKCDAATGNQQNLFQAVRAGQKTHGQT
jgi:hypothetical protein